LFAAEEAEELHFDDAGVVAGLNTEDALKDDFLGEDFLLGAEGELFGDGAGDEVLEDAAVECAGEGDGEGLADDARVAVEVAEHRDLGDQCGHQAESGAELGEGVEEVLAVLVAFGGGVDLDAEDALDDVRVGAVDRELEPAAEETPPEGSYRDHLGVQPQKQPGLHYAAFSVTSGRITTDQLRRLAALADAYGDGTLRLTTTQNIAILNIPAERLPAFEGDAAGLGIPLRATPFERGTVSCTGSEFCKLAITETKHFSIRLAAELADRLPEVAESVKLHVTGCPNACGQHWIADVGLQGVRVKQGAEEVDGFDVFVGGGLGARSGVAHRVGFRATADDIPDALERLFGAWHDGRDGGESFRAWSSRVGDATVKATLASGVRSSAAGSAS